MTFRRKLDLAFAIAITIWAAAFATGEFALGVPELANPLIGGMLGLVAAWAVSYVIAKEL